MYELLTALGTILHPGIIIFLLGGTLVGLLFGVVPGLQNVTALSIFLPFTYALEPAQALIFMVGVYAAGVYGGSITAILYNIPGAPENAATTFDGYPLAVKGQAGKALGTAIIASCFGGIFSCAVLILAAPQVAQIALEFGPAEYFAIVFFALCAVALMGSSMIKTIISALLGLLFVTVGIDTVSGGARFTFGSEFLLTGFDFVALMVGVFAVAEVLVRAERSITREPAQKRHDGATRASLPDFGELNQMKGTLLRCSSIGTIVGVMPGLGAAVAAFFGYETERRVSKDRVNFGKGSLAGVAAPESANNASVGGAMIPLLTLGIPGSSATAVMLGAFQIYGLQPGESLFREQGDLVYLIFASLILANLAVIAVGIFAIRFLSRMLDVPNTYFAPVIILLCAIGAFTVRNNMLDVWAMFGFGVLGYVLNKGGFSIPVFVLAFILGPLAETSFTRAMILFDDDVSKFFSRPLSSVFITLGLISLITPVALRSVRHRMNRQRISAET